MTTVGRRRLAPRRSPDRAGKKRATQLIGSPPARGRGYKGRLQVRGLPLHRDEQLRRDAHGGGCLRPTNTSKALFRRGCRKAAEIIADKRAELVTEQLANKQDIADVRRDIRESEQRVIIRLGSMMVMAVGVVALVKLL